MRVLFVCRANVGRSQMAEAFFNKLVSGNSEAKSAGTLVGEKEGRKIGGDEKDLVRDLLQRIEINS